MKGIILAGGMATRIRPITDVVSKQLLPVYDKPMIYFPLSVLMLAGIREVLVISTPEYISFFMKLLDDGCQFGLHIEYKIQNEPKGLADAFLLGEKFINNDCCALVLGDNFLWGDELEKTLKVAVSHSEKGFATIFGREVRNPKEFGVAVLDKNTGLVNKLIEKPNEFVSNYAVIGLYFYDKSVCSYAKQLAPSKRNELEITDLNNKYVQNGKLKFILLEDEKFDWVDVGSFDGLFDASECVRRKQSEMSPIAIPEEIAFRKGWISLESLKISAKKYEKSKYGKYLMKIVTDYEVEQKKALEKKDVSTAIPSSSKKREKKQNEEDFDNDMFKNNKDNKKEI